MLLFFDLHICTHAYRHVLTLHHTLYIHRDPQRIFLKIFFKKIAPGISKSHLQKRKRKSQTLSHANLTFQQIILFYVVLGSKHYLEALEDGVVSTEGLFKNQLPAPPCFCTSITRDKNKKKKSEIFSKALSPGWLISLWTVLGTVKRCVRSGWWY